MHKYVSQRKGEVNMENFTPLIVAAVVAALVVLLIAVGYVKAPPDMAYIISGIKKKSKVVIGKASIRSRFSSASIS